MQTKNDWNKLFKNFSSNLVIMKSKEGKEVFKLDAVLVLIGCLVIPGAILLLLIMLLTESWYFEVETKPSAASD